MFFYILIYKEFYMNKFKASILIAYLLSAAGICFFAYNPPLGVKLMTAGAIFGLVCGLVFKKHL